MPVCAWPNSVGQLKYPLPDGRLNAAYSNKPRALVLTVDSVIGVVKEHSRREGKRREEEGKK
jgi:hypothetical protein